MSLARRRSSMARTSTTASMASAERRRASTSARRSSALPGEMPQGYNEAMAVKRLSLNAPKTLAGLASRMEVKGELDTRGDDADGGGEIVRALQTMVDCALRATPDDPGCLPEVARLLAEEAARRGPGAAPSAPSRAPSPAPAVLPPPPPPAAAMSPRVRSLFAAEAPSDGSDDDAGAEETKDELAGDDASDGGDVDTFDDASPVAAARRLSEAASRALLARSGLGVVVAAAGGPLDARRLRALVVAQRTWRALREWRRLDAGLRLQCWGRSVLARRALGDREDPVRARAWVVFKTLDGNGDGVLTRAEVAEALVRNGVCSRAAAERRARAMIASADESEDDVVSFDEFLQQWRRELLKSKLTMNEKLKHMIAVFSEGPERPASER